MPWPTCRVLARQSLASARRAPSVGIAVHGTSTAGSASANPKAAPRWAAFFVPPRLFCGGVLSHPRFLYIDCHENEDVAKNQRKNCHILLFLAVSSKKKRGCGKNKAPELPHPRKRDTGCQKNEDMANARPGIATSSFLRPIATELGCSSQWAGLLWARGARFITTCSGLWGLVASSVIISPNGYDFHPARNVAAWGPSNSQRGITWMRQTPSFRWTARSATWPK